MTDQGNAALSGEWDAIRRKAGTEPLGIDISSFSDEWCEGFLAGQESVLEEIETGRLVLPPMVRDDA